MPCFLPCLQSPSWTGLRPAVSSPALTVRARWAPAVPRGAPEWMPWGKCLSSSLGAQAGGAVGRGALGVGSGLSVLLDHSPVTLPTRPPQAGAMAPK